MTCACCFLHTTHPQQQCDPSFYDIGNWKWIEVNPPNYAIWRTGSVQSQDQNYGDYGPNNAWQDFYGIHAALLPVTSLQNELKHGWVILWGYGHQRHVNNQSRLEAPSADPLYPNNYFVSRVGMTPFLLWHPKDSNTTNHAHLNGYVRYLFDDDLWTSTYGDWPIYKMFCAGHAFLPDGRLFLAGGDGDLYNSSNGVAGYVGLRLKAILDPWAFDPFNTNQSQSFWSTANAMSEPRWYPTVIALPSGNPLIVGGTHYKLNSSSGPVRSEKYEVYDLCTETLSDWLFPEMPPDLKGDLGDLYPRLHLVSYMNSAGNGLDTPRVVYTGFGRRTYWLNALQPETGWNDYSSPLRFRGRRWGSSVLLPNPADNPESLSQQVLSQVMVVGGDGGAVNLVTHTTEILTFAAGSSGGTLSRVYGPSMNKERMHLNTVLLPTGEIVAIGGIKDRVSEWDYPEDVVLETDLYTKMPSTGQYEWKPVAPAPQEDRDGGPYPVMDGTRVYHSTALLLTDGTVLTTGSATSDRNGRPVNNQVPTIYSPPYLFKPDGCPRSTTDRPRIIQLSESELSYGQVFSATIEYGAETTELKSVVLMRPGSATHSFNFEQRLVKLPFKPDGDALDLTAPWDPAIAPPGWYMLFLVDSSSAPSEAAWIRLKSPNCEGEAAFHFNLDLEDVAPQVHAEQAEQVEHSPIVIEFRDPWSGEVKATYRLPMIAPDDQGRVSLPLYSDLPELSYQVYLRPCRSWLSKRVLIDWARGGQLSVSLRNGDVNGDNGVDALDLAIVLAQMAASDSGSGSHWSADVNLDGMVDEDDLTIIVENLGAEGD